MTTQNDSTDTHTSVQPHYAPQLDVLYRPEVSFEGNDENHASRTPTKARRFLEHVADQKLSDYLNILREFGPLANSEFLRAHTREYVEAFFRGEEPHASSNGLEWSPEFAESVRYTNSSLVHAVENALAHPARISLSPTGGFHHASPESGRGFCSMSGQAIAALRVYEQRGAVGAWSRPEGRAIFGRSWTLRRTRSRRPKPRARHPPARITRPAASRPRATKSPPARGSASSSACARTTRRPTAAARSSATDAPR